MHRTGTLAVVGEVWVPRLLAAACTRGIARVLGGGKESGIL